MKILYNKRLVFSANQSFESDSKEKINRYLMELTTLIKSEEFKKLIESGEIDELKPLMKLKLFSKWRSESENKWSEILIRILSEKELSELREFVESGVLDRELGTLERALLLMEGKMEGSEILSIFKLGELGELRLSKSILSELSESISSELSESISSELSESELSNLIEWAEIKIFTEYIEKVIKNCLQGLQDVNADKTIDLDSYQNIPFLLQFAKGAVFLGRHQTKLC